MADALVQRVAMWRPLIRVAAVVGPLASCAVLALFRDDIAAASAVLVLVLWVVGAAATGDRIAGVAAALSGAAWFDFFLTAPYETFTINDSDDIEATVLLMLIGVAVTEIALWGYRQQSQAARRSGYLDGVVGVAATVAGGEVPPSAVIEVVGTQIAKTLDADESRFVRGPIHDRRVAVLDHDGALTRNGLVSDVDRAGLPVDEYVGVPVHRGSVVLGHFLVTATSHVARPSREQRRVAVLLADQVAPAISDDVV